MSILSDGSQARKTNSEKELILVQTERNGIPVYFVVLLLEMANLGASNADSIKAAIDSVFASRCEEGENSVKGPIPLVDYNTNVVSATADGASVNFGVYLGLTQMKNERVARYDSPCKPPSRACFESCCARFQSLSRSRFLLSEYLVVAKKLW